MLCKWHHRSVKVAVVLIFIILGWKYINNDNYNPYIPDNTGNFGDFGFSGIIRAAAIVFFAYIGFDAVSTAAQEAKNPKRDMPMGILGSLAICTILIYFVCPCNDRCYQLYNICR